MVTTYSGTTLPGGTWEALTGGTVYGLGSINTDAASIVLDDASGASGTPAAQASDKTVPARSPRLRETVMEGSHTCCDIRDKGPPL